MAWDPFASGLADPLDEKKRAKAWDPFASGQADITQRLEAPEIADEPRKVGLMDKAKALMQLPGIALERARAGEFARTLPLGTERAASSMARGLANEGHAVFSEVEDAAGMGFGAGATGKARAVMEAGRVAELRAADPERYGEATAEQLRMGLLPENREVAPGVFEVSPVDEAAAAAGREMRDERGAAKAEFETQRWQEGLAKDFGELTKRLDAGTQEALGVSDEYLQTFAGQVASGIGGLPVYIGAAMTGKPGLVALQGAVFDEAWQDYEATVGEDDFDPKQAFRIASMYAVVGTALERMGLDAMLGKLFGAAKRMSGRELAQRAGAGALGEGATESSQGFLVDALARVAYDHERELLTPEALKGRLREFAVGATVGAVGAGGAVGVEQGVAAVVPQSRDQATAPERNAEEAALFGDVAAVADSAAVDDRMWRDYEAQFAEQPAAEAAPPRPQSQVDPIPAEAARSEPGSTAGEPTVTQPEAVVKRSEPKAPAVGDMEAIRRMQKRDLRAKAKAEKMQGDHEVKPKGARFMVGTRADGEHDLLNDIEELGGIMSPKAAARAGKMFDGEYDGFFEVFGGGTARLLVRADGKGLDIDQIAVGLSDRHPDIQTAEDVKAAVEKAVQTRRMVKGALQRQEQDYKWEAMALNGDRTRGVRKAGPPVYAYELGDGDTFTVGGAPVRVSVLETTERELDGGDRWGYRRAEPEVPIYPDEGSLVKAEREATGTDDPFRTAADALAAEPAEARAQRRERIAADTAKWQEVAERLAPGAMQDYSVRVGSMLELASIVEIPPGANVAAIEAAHIASRKMIFMVDKMVASRGDMATLVTLQHELGHAHWNTLSEARKTELEAMWQREVEAGEGPLYRERALKRGVALHVETDVKEWYAERIAFANHQWGKRRSGLGGQASTVSGPLGRAAQNLRIWLRQALEWLQGKFGKVDDIDAAYREFADLGERASDSGQGLARLDVAARESEQVSFAQRELATADLGRTVEEQATRRRTVRNRLRGGPVGRIGQKWLASRGDMPEAAFLAIRSRNARMNSAVKSVEFALTDFNRAARDELGGWKALTRGQEQAINDHLAGRAKWESGPPRMLAALDRMRAHVDGLSRRLIDEGVVDGDLLGRVEGNIGFYLNRSYRKYDDKKWASKVMEAKPGTELARIRTQAHALIKGEMRADLVKELADAEWLQAHPDAKRINRRSDEYKAMLAALQENRDVQPDPAYVMNKLETLLRADVTPEVYLGGANPNKKQLGVFKKRKSIPAEIRALWGEHSDARINYARSVMKTMQIVETHRALKEIRELGLGQFLWERDFEVPGGGVALASEGNAAMAPLDGLYTTPEIKAAFVEATSPAAPNAALGLWYRMNGLVKMSKTVFSPVTQVRNHVANYGFMLAGGHFLLGHGGKSWGIFSSEFLGRDTEKRRAYIQRMTRLGVIGDSVYAGEIREAMRDALGSAPGDMGWAQFAERTAARAAKWTPRKAVQLYQLNDDIFKAYAFENERSKLAWAMDGKLSPDQLDTLAARRIRDTMPNYSMIPKAFQMVRRAGLTGSFLSFATESMRTLYHNARVTVEDLRDPNPRMKMLGALRLAGLSTALAAPHAVQMITQALMGVDDEEDMRIRRFLPEYTRNGNLAYVGKEGGGEYRLMDLSYMDVWNWQKRMVNAFLYNESPEAMAVEFFKETYSPVFGEGLVSKAVYDLARNATPNGRPVWEEAASFDDKLMAMSEYIGRVVEPGLVTTARRIQWGATEHVSPTGRKYELSDELVAVATGLRMQSVSVAQSLEFRASGYMALSRSAARLYNQAANHKGKPDVEAALEGYHKANDAKRRAWEDMRQLTLDAFALGVPEPMVRHALQEGGVGTAESESLLGGLYRPYAPSEIFGVKLR